MTLVILFVLAEAATYCYIFYRVNFGDSADDRKYFSGKIIFPKYNTNTIDTREGVAKYFKPREPAFPPANIPWGRPIVTFGCSYTYGNGLEPEQTYPYRLAMIMGRPVYNVAQGAWGIQHMLNELETGMGLDGINNPEFAIYLFIGDHMRRLSSVFGNSPWPTEPYVFNSTPYLTYVEKNGKLVPKKYPHRIIFANWLLFDQIYHAITAEEFYNNNIFSLERRPAAKKKVMELVKLHFLQSYEEIQKRWPDAKFVIIIYDIPAPDEEDTWKELEKKGIIFIRLYEIAKSKGIDHMGAHGYTLADGAHPNEKLWDAVTPEIAKKLDEISNKGAANAN